MPKIISSIGEELYKVEIQSQSGNTIIADEPISSGGKDLGLSPKELLVAALAACTSATLKMYANRKGWDLKEIKLEIDLEMDEENKNTRIEREIELIGDLSQEQIEKLLVIADKCPVHKILTNPVEIKTVLKIS